MAPFAIPALALVVVDPIFSQVASFDDRGGKFHKYMRIPSLQEYVTVSQSERMIDHSIRQADNSWLVRELVPADGQIPVQCLGVELELADVYNQVEFDRPSA